MDNLKILKELNVLYVDDDKRDCESLKHILQYYFKEVYIASNGIEAFEIYESKSCHLLIVDYDMPLMNGYEFLSKVREVDEHIGAFIMSSYDDKVKLKNAIKLNLLDYISKPYELKELQKSLELFVKYAQKKEILKYDLCENCFYDMIRQEIQEKDIKHKLTSYEAKILEYLINHQNKVVSYEKLMDSINSSNQKSIISIIYKIKQKLPANLIENIKDTGYRFKR